MAATNHACVQCNAWMRPRKNGVVVLETFDDGIKPYKIWQADLWECPSCARQTISGFAFNAISEHFMPDFDKYLKLVTHTIVGCPGVLRESR